MNPHVMLRRVALGTLLLTQARCATSHALTPNYVVKDSPHHPVLTQGGLIQITNGSGYLAYQTPTPKDVPHFHFVKRARGEVCQNDLRLPLQLQGSRMAAALSAEETLDMVWGNASVARGMADAMLGAPEGAVLYDITLDLHQSSLFGLFFRRQCLVVSGSLAVAAPGANNLVGPVEALVAPSQEEAPAAKHESLSEPAALPLAPIGPARTAVPKGHSGHKMNEVRSTHQKSRHSPKHRHKNAASKHKHPGAQSRH